VVVELTQPVRTVLRELPADLGAGKPARLYLDLAGVWVGKRYQEGLPVGDGLLQGVRVGQNTLSTARLVLDLERYDRHRLIELSHPDRVVIDVYGRRPGERPRDRRETPGDLGRLPVGLRPVETIVIDAGHGGRDPGAIGVNGLREKDVTLRLARSLGEKLSAQGFEIVYTRSDDRTISLEERTAICGIGRWRPLRVAACERRAARLGGRDRDLLPGRQPRAPQPRGGRARERRASGQVDVLQRTVAKLRVGEVSVHSRRAANTVHQQMVSGCGGRYREVIDLGVEEGAVLRALLLSNIPAILVEAGS
jgi:N-acetylmuramoyl-L-alanine amidase